MSNHRSTCYYCKQQVLSRDVGRHMMKKHEADIFRERENVKAIHKEKYLREPIMFTIGEDPFYFCLADNSCIRRSDIALNHFKGKTDAHRDILLKLREKYPMDSSQPVGDAVVRREYLSDAETKTLQEFIIQVVLSDAIGFTKKDKAVFSKLGICVEEEKLKKDYPELFPEEKEEEEQKEEQEEEVKEEPIVEEEKPEEAQTPVLPPPKHITKEDLFKQLMTEKDIKNLSTSVLTGQSLEIPELKQYQKNPSFPRPSDLQLLTASRPSAPPPVRLITATKRQPKQV